MTVSLPNNDPPQDVQQLEDQLSRPTAEVIDMMARCDSDLVMLGVGGKMGPTMARMARRAMDEVASRRPRRLRRR